jgi:hypothetical protein
MICTKDSKGKAADKYKLPQFLRVGKKEILLLTRVGIFSTSNLKTHRLKVK